jgi:hypothetical protein
MPLVYRPTTPPGALGVSRGPSVFPQSAIDSGEPRAN